MVRGRRVDETLPLSNSLLQQREFRARRAAKLKDLENANDDLRAENTALISQLEQANRYIQRLRERERDTLPSSSSSPHARLSDEVNLEPGPHERYPTDHHYHPHHDQTAMIPNFAGPSTPGSIHSQSKSQPHSQAQSLLRRRKRRKDPNEDDRQRCHCDCHDIESDDTVAEDVDTGPVEIRGRSALPPAGLSEEARIMAQTELEGAVRSIAAVADLLRGDGHQIGTGLEGILRGAGLSAMAATLRHDDPGRTVRMEAGERQSCPTTCNRGTSSQVETRSHAHLGRGVTAHPPLQHRPLSGSTSPSLKDHERREHERLDEIDHHAYSGDTPANEIGISGPAFRGDLVEIDRERHSPPIIPSQLQSSFKDDECCLGLISCDANPESYGDR